MRNWSPNTAVTVGVPDRVAPLDGRLPVETRLETAGEPENGTALLFADGEVIFTGPLFEPQPRLDPEEGFLIPLQVPSPDRILAVYQHKSWWVRPAFPVHMADIPERTQLLLLQYPAGTLCVLAVTDDLYRSDLMGGKDWDLQIRCRSGRVGDSRVHTLCAALAWDADPYKAVRKAAAAAAQGRGTPCLLRQDRKYPEIFEGYGWCTWDAFYHAVDERGIFAKLDELKEKKVPVRWVLIDDGWLDADLDRQRLRGLDADPAKFPHGLAGTVARIKEEYGIPYVGVWHAVMGYWCGLEPGSEAERLLGAYCRHLPDGRIVIDADEDKAFGFYNTWHRYLHETCGIDFVKVDSQSSLSVFYRGIGAYGEVSGAIQRGLERSVRGNFGGAVINCMGMAPEDVWSRPSTMVTRTSDDFVPDVPEGFVEHAMQNAYDSLWTGNFYTGDWDMYFSDHPENRLSAALRAVSGGPVYTSDRVGRTDPAWILPLTDGAGRIRRGGGVGLPTPGCLFTDPRGQEGDGVLKVYNHREGQLLIAAFDLRRDRDQAEAVLAWEELAGCLADSGIDPGAVQALRVRRPFEGTEETMPAGEALRFGLPRGGGELFEIEAAG